MLKNKNLLIALFILLKFVLQYFAIDPVYELHRDEYLHLDLGKHLAWGSSSVPPLTAFISYIILLFGSSVFWIKFFPALFGALVIVVVWKIIEELNGGIFALILGAVSIVFSVLLRINTLYQPTSFEYLIWTSLFFSMIKYFNSQNNKWLYISAIVIASGILNKYNVVFLVLGLLPALLITEHRKILINKHAYFSVVLCFLIISPNIIWQINNKFPVVHHMIELSDTQLVNITSINFLKDQLLFFFGSLFAIILALFSFFIYEPFRKYRIFFWTFLFTLSLYLIFRAKSYYAIGLYPVLIAFGSVYIEKLFSKGWLNKIKYIIILIPVLLTVPMLKLIIPIQSPEEIIQNPKLFKQLGLLRWEDGKDHNLPQDFADMIGWAEMAHLVDSAFSLVEEKKNTLIFCDNYGQAGAVNYYSKQSYTQAVSFNADYINWFPLDEMEIQHVIMVKSSYDPDKERKREIPMFSSIEVIGEVSTNNAREKGTRIYLLKDAKISINKVLHEEIQNRKSHE